MSRLCLVALLLVSQAWSAAPPVAEPLPAGAIRRVGTARFRHGGLVRSLAFSPDGRWLASASHDRTVSVWEVQTGHERCRCQGHGTHVLCVDWAATGELLASGAADGVVRLWDARTGQERHVFRTGAASVEALAFSPEGKRLAIGGDDGVTRVIDVSTRKEVVRRSEDHPIDCLAWSPDGKQLATSATRGPAALWDAATGRVNRFLGEEPAQCLAFAPSGKHLVTRENGGLFRLWDAERGRELRQWQGDGTSGGVGAMIYQIAFRRDGRTVYAGNLEGGIDEWDVETGRRVGRLAGRHHGRVAVVAAAPGGDLIASGGADHAVHLWRPAWQRALTPQVETPPVRVPLPVASATDSLFVKLPTSRQTCVWDRRVFVAGDGRRLVILQECLLSGTRIKEEDANPVVAVAGADGQGGTIVTSHRDGSLWVRDIYGTRLRRLGEGLGHAQPVLSPNGSLVAAVGREALVRMWNAETGRALTPLAGHRGGALAAAFSPDNKLLATGGRDGMMRIWDISRRREVLPPSRHADWVSAVAFDRAGRRIATGTERGDVLLWSADTGARLGELPGHRGAVTGLSFSDDGKRLVSAAGDTTVLVWDVEKNR